MKSWMEIEKSKERKLCAKNEMMDGNWNGQQHKMFER